MRRFVSFYVVLAFLVGGCAGGDGPSLGDARTYYESLDLSTPGAGAETFVDAFARDDFMTVFLVLHPDTQERIRVALDLLHYREVIEAEAIPRDEIAEIFRSFPPESIDVWYFFDAFMLVADEHDAFHIDLSGQVTLEPTESSDVLAAVEGIDGEVVIKMTESPGGDWRVYQVIAPGGNAEDFPWSVPNRAP